MTFAAKAPKTVNSFKFLADKGFFDHTRCHRLTTMGIYVLQCGDPTASANNPGGSGGPGYALPDENLKAFGKADAQGVVTYPAGTVAMANSGPDTNGSQFFIVTTEAAPWLDGKHTVFGRVSSGMDVVDEISGVDRDGSDRPREPVTIDRVELS